MDIFAPITRSQTLLQQLSAAISNHNESEIHTLFASLSDQLDHIKTNTSTMQQQLTQLRKNHTTTTNLTSLISIKPEIKSGCYIFAGEKGFFCPICYDQNNSKVPTSRINSKVRVCPVCRATIK